MGNFPEDSKNQFYLAWEFDSREKSAHTYTHSRHYVPSLATLQPQWSYPEKDWTPGSEGSQPADR